MHASLAGWSMLSRILSQLFRKNYVRLEIECVAPFKRKMKLPFTIKTIDKLDAALTLFQCAHTWKSSYLFGKVFYRANWCVKRFTHHKSCNERLHFLQSYEPVWTSLICTTSPMVIIMSLLTIGSRAHITTGFSHALWDSPDWICLFSNPPVWNLPLPSR